MHVGVAAVRFRVDGSRSLKEKRQVVRRIKDQVRQRFNVAIAEVGELDDRRTAEIGFTCISNDARHAMSILTNVADYIETAFPIVVIDVQTELW